MGLSYFYIYASWANRQCPYSIGYLENNKAKKYRSEKMILQRRGQIAVSKGNERVGHTAKRAFNAENAVQQTMHRPFEAEKIQAQHIDAENTSCGDDCDADKQYYGVEQRFIHFTGLIEISFWARCSFTSLIEYSL